jgi:hypothetical protein
MLIRSSNRRVDRKGNQELARKNPAIHARSRTPAAHMEAHGALDILPVERRPLKCIRFLFVFVLRPLYNVFNSVTIPKL